MPFAESIGFFQFFNDFLHVKMKEVDYTNIDRIKTLIASIAIGCQHNKDINHKLVPYKGSAECCGLAQFPDQSQINRFIKRFDIYNISELDFIFEHLLSCYGLWRSQQKVDIDFDCSGITVYGKRYELARKGYFPKKRSSRGYQLSLTTTANTPFKEILSLHLDQGNACADNHFWDGIYQATEILGDLDRIGLVRADAASGTGPNIEALVDHNLSFLIKGKNCKTAQNFAKRLSYENWTPLNYFVKIADMHNQTIPNCLYRVRVIVVETISPKGRIVYSHLYTNLENKPEVIYHNYNERQNIESIIKEGTYGLYIKSLRTRKYLGIYSFLYFCMITYNLLSLFRTTVLKDTKLATMSIIELTNKLMDIPAKIQMDNGQLSLVFPENHKFCKDYLKIVRPKE